MSSNEIERSRLARSRTPSKLGWWGGLALGVLGCSGPTAAEPERWEVVFQDLDGALTSVAGSDENDVWVVGAESESTPTILHFDGAGWQEPTVRASGDAFWVHATGPRTAVIGGSKGMLLHGDVERGFELRETPGSSTVWGVWGAAADDLWAVGGDPDVTPGFVWRYDGSLWRDVSSEASTDPLPPVFKVWGSAADDVWLVGMDGLILHYDGSAFERSPSPSSRRLFTVHGGADEGGPVVAVGGFGDAVILEHEDGTWSDNSGTPAPFQLFGVHVSESHTYAVGMDGLVLRREAGTWQEERTGLEIFDPLHAVWVDPTGRAWAVGGDLLSPSLREGVLMRGPASRQ